MLARDPSRVYLKSPPFFPQNEFSLYTSKNTKKEFIDLLYSLILSYSKMTQRALGSSDSSNSNDNSSNNTKSSSNERDDHKR